MSMSRTTELVNITRRRCSQNSETGRSHPKERFRLLSADGVWTAKLVASRPHESFSPVSARIWVPEERASLLMPPLLLDHLFSACVIYLCCSIDGYYKRASQRTIACPPAGLPASRQSVRRSNAAAVAVASAAEFKSRKTNRPGSATGSNAEVAAATAESRRGSRHFIVEENGNEKSKPDF